MTNPYINECLKLEDGAPAFSYYQNSTFYSNFVFQRTLTNPQPHIYRKDLQTAKALY
jgi:hypothetical protein